MILGSTQPLTEISTRNLPGGKGQPARKADLTIICEPIVYKMSDPRSLTNLCTSTDCYRDSFTFSFTAGNQTPAIDPVARHYTD
jgi:hypothetical protein